MTQENKLTKKEKTNKLIINYNVVVYLLFHPKLNKYFEIKPSKPILINQETWHISPLRATFMNPTAYFIIRDPFISYIQTVNCVISTYPEKPTRPLLWPKMLEGNITTVYIFFKHFFSIYFVCLCERFTEQFTVSVYYNRVFLYEYPVVGYGFGYILR